MELLLLLYTHVQSPFSLWIGNNDVLGYATTWGWNNQLRPAGAAGVGFDATMMIGAALNWYRQRCSGKYSLC
jgi:hypothetical protein